MWLLGCAVRVLPCTLIGRTVVRLRVRLLPLEDLLFVYVERIAIDPRGELVELLFVGVAAHSGHVHVVPPVKTADEIDPGDMAVGEHRPPVQTPAVQHRVVVIPPDDDQVDVADEGTNRLPIRNLTPFCDLDSFHDDLLPILGLLSPSILSVEASWQFCISESVLVLAATFWPTHTGLRPLQPFCNIHSVRSQQNTASGRGWCRSEMTSQE